MANVEKYINSCRVCLKDCKNLPFVDIFTTLVKQSNVLIFEAINELTGLNVSFFVVVKELSGFSKYQTL